MKRGIFLTLVISLTFATRAADLHVPEAVISTETAAVVNLNITKIKADQLIKTLTTISGKAPEAGQADQLKDMLNKLMDAGAATVSLVVSVAKDAAAANPADGVLLVIEKKEGADTAKLTDFLNTNIPGMKDSVGADCPKEIDGKLVWYSKTGKMPTANADRATTFSTAQYEVSDETSLSVVFVPQENATAAAAANLKGEEADLVKAIMDGGGICLSSNFGVADAPTLKLLLLAADATGAEKVHTAVTGLIAALGKDAPPDLKALIGALKADQVGSNVQLSVAILDWAKAAMAMAPK